MGETNFIKQQLFQIGQGGSAVLFRKMKRILRISHKLPLFILTIPIIVIIRLIKPWLLVRWHELPSPRIGHFAAETEMYLCEQDAGINVPRQRYVDIFYMERQICNQQLAEMWKRVIRVWPGWIMSTICGVNQLIPGWWIHEIGNNTQKDMDPHNLLDRFPPHLKFNAEEEARGEAGLRKIGVTAGTPFIILIVRDSAYLDSHQSKDWSYHNYRDSDINNYVMAAEEMANRGYFVIRMGTKVRKAIKTSHPRVIDYVTNGIRSDFMDIYLGANCEFCILSNSGFYAVPLIFRRPVVSVNMIPIGYLISSVSQKISITRHHLAVKQGRKLTLREIFTHNVGFSLSTDNFESNGIQLIENTPEEIRNVVIEMAERLNGTWQPEPNDDALQRRFWEIFPVHVKDPDNKRPMHGEIRARIGSHFLRNNSEFLK